MSLLQKAKQSKKHRTIYIKNPETWRMAQDKAAAEGRSLSEVIESHLVNYANPHSTELKLDAIRRILLGE